MNLLRRGPGATRAGRPGCDHGSLLRVSAGPGVPSVLRGRRADVAGSAGVEAAWIHACDGGSGTVAIAGICALCAVLTVLIALAGAVHTAGVQAGLAADLGALAGGDRSASGLWGSASPMACEAARQVVEANGAELEECWTDGQDTLVVVRRSVDVGPLDVPARARARAGVIGP